MKILHKRERLMINIKAKSQDEFKGIMKFLDNHLETIWKYETSIKEENERLINELKDTLESIKKDSFNEGYEQAKKDLAN